MATPAPSETSRIRSETARGEYSKRTILLSALVLVLILVGGVAVVAVTSDGSPKVGEAGVSQESGAKPESIPLPGSGKAPENAADRGGSEQLAVFGIMAGAMLFIGVVVFRGGKKSRAGRNLWLAAAASGQDGAVARQGELAPGASASAASVAGPGAEPPG